MGNLTVNTAHVKQPKSEKNFKEKDKHNLVGERGGKCFTTK